MTTLGHGPRSLWRLATGFLAPLAVTDPEQAQRARMFHVVGLTTVALVNVVLPVVILVQPDITLRALFVIVVVNVLVLFTLLLNRRGQSRLAGWLYIGVILALLTFNARTAGGIRSPGVQAYFVFVMLAGLLLGERVGVITAGICASLGLGLVALETLGVVSPEHIYLAGALWLLTCVYIGVALLVMRLATGAVRESLARAEAELVERRATEERLGERVKELRLLHEAAQLLRQRPPLDRGVLAELVALMPAAWKYSEDCRARITYEDLVVESPGWQPSPWRLASVFGTSKGRGLMEVAYLREHPPADEGPFLAEERSLIDSLAELLRSHIERHATEGRRQALESQLRQAQKMDALGTLAGGIAHDFNNILTAIGGNAELARADLPGDSRAREDLDEILVAHARATDLVKRILLFSRRQDTQHSVMALPPVVDEVLKLLRASLPPQITIRQTTGPALPPVSADATQMHQVLMNLGTNAGYAMKETGGTLSVDLDTVTITDLDTEPSADLALGPYLRLTVRDTGTGMSPEIRQRLFEPFFSTKGRAGTGLGLSVVHGIVQEHGGAITVASELGKGTEFRIYLPAAAAEEQPVAPAAPMVIRGTGQHVMYVDDDEALARVMARTIRRLGYRCTEFVDATVALQEFRTNPHAFDAVVTDLQMAAMSGVDLAHALRAVRPDIPVAVASGYGRADAGVSDGTVSAWLHKPATLPELSRTLQVILLGRGHSPPPPDPRTWPGPK